MSPAWKLVPMPHDVTSFFSFFLSCSASSHTVARNEIQELCADSMCKSERSDRNGTRACPSWGLCSPSVLWAEPYIFISRLSAGFQEALLFLRAKQIPDTWKMDLSEILESSSSDEGEGKESEEEEKEPEPEEVRCSYCFIKDDCRRMCLDVRYFCLPCLCGGI